MSSIEEQTGLKTVPKYIDCIDFNSEGYLSLATSNLTGNYWNGALITFSNPDFAPNLPHIDYAGLNEAGCTYVEWVDNETLATSTDAGTVEIWKLKKAPMLENTLCFAEHDDICSSLSVSKVSGQILSSSWDGCIKLWDLEADLSINNFFLHTDHVLSVKWCPNSSDLFCSVARDGKVLTYDNRLNDKPATVLNCENITYPTCIDWISETKMCVGYDDGSLRILDARNTKENVNTFRPHKKTINTLLNVPEKNIVLSGSDDMQVLSIDLEGHVNYITKHTDYVRCVKLYEEKVFSSGWDGQILKSTIQNGLSVKMET